MKLIFASVLVAVIYTINLSAQNCISNVDLLRFLADTSNINRLDSLGKKQGPWVFTGIACNYGLGWNNDYASKFDFCEVCAIGTFKDGIASDTVFYFDKQGLLLRTSVPFISKDKPTLITYYESGHVQREEYHYLHGEYNYWVNQYSVIYSDSLPGCAIVKYLHDGTEISYTNCKMAVRTSSKHYNYYIKEVSESGSKKIPYAVEKGKFKNERLYNGFIYYYSEHDSLLRTIKVSEGKHLNDATLSFSESYLDQLLNHYPRIDIDFSGTIERSEMKHFNSLLPVESIEINKEVPVVDFPEVIAAFPGGEPALKIYLDNNKIYPPTAFDNKEEGTVYVSFIIEKDGSISSIVVLRGVSSAIDAGVIRLIKAMPRWEPAWDQGKVVRSKYVLPVKFVL